MWELFVICELTDVKHQKDGQKFIDILNNVRIGKAIDFDFVLLAKNKTDIDKIKTDTTVPLAENALKDSYNLNNLVNIPYPPLEIKAIGKFLADISRK